MYSTDEMTNSREKLEMPEVKPVPVPYGLPRVSAQELTTNTVSCGKSEVVPAHTMMSHGEAKVHLLHLVLMLTIDWGQAGGWVINCMPLSLYH
jgi:hypothetical protein